MSLYRSSSVSALVLFCAAGLARGQSTSDPDPEPAHDKVLKLDAVVVSAGSDGKTAFDLAQGTSVLSGDELRQRIAATIGETLSSTAGVNSTYYGPGASRPVIRGLGGDRVRVLTNNIGSLDASNISPDHNAAIEPLFAQRIEVLRGPSTLLYGSSAVGGVINVIDNRIPTTPGDGSLHGTIEARGFGAGGERTGVASVGAGNANVAFQVDALKQKSDDVSIPGVARIDENAPANQRRGTLPDSAVDAWSGSVGGSAFWKAGHLGVSANQYETLYGVPTGDDPPVTINMKQTRFDLAGDITEPFGIFRGAKARLGYGRYRHSEIDGDEIATTFNNRAWEGRLELPHAAIGDVTGTIGLQGARSDFSAAGEEVVTPPSLTNSGAIFALEELKRDKLTFQFGARYEGETIKLGQVNSSLPALPGYSARSNEKKSFGGVSGSLGLVYYPQKDWSVGASLSYTERLPTAQELFSNGPHGGTGAYEIGSSHLDSEKSLGLDLSLRRRTGFVTGTFSVFANKFDGYIFEQELAAGSVPLANNPDSLTPYQFVAKDALFYGAEAEIALHLVDRKDYHVHLELMSDFVHAEQTTDHEPIPRISPMRYGAGLKYENAKWNLGVEVRRTAEQDRFAPTETSTPGYTMINANVSYLLALEKVSYEVFLHGNNLSDEEARVHSSFLKDFSPLPGRGVTAGVRVSF